MFDNLIEKKKCPLPFRCSLRPAKCYRKTKMKRLTDSIEVLSMMAWTTTMRAFIRGNFTFHRIAKKPLMVAIILSKTGNDRAIGGSSSGAVCVLSQLLGNVPKNSQKYSAPSELMLASGCWSLYNSLSVNMNPNPFASSCKMAPTIWTSTQVIGGKRMNPCKGL